MNTMLAGQPTTTTTGKLSPPLFKSNPSLFAHRIRFPFHNNNNNNTIRNHPLSFSVTKYVPDKPVDSLLQNDIPNPDVPDVRVEGVIQFDSPNQNYLNFTKWSRIALLAGGDVLALLIFSAIGRFSHGFSVFDTETLRTADPFIAGWFLSAYFLGGYGEDGRGMNGYSNAVIAAAKSWALGIPIGVGIRAASIGHLPPPSFILVTMGSTAVLLIGWRTLLYSIFPNDGRSKKDDTFRRGSPFELFELLISLIRRW